MRKQHSVVFQTVSIRWPFLFETRQNFADVSNQAQSNNRLEKHHQKKKLVSSSSFPLLREYQSTDDIKTGRGHFRIVDFSNITQS